MKHIPNLVTMLNLFLGCAAVVLILESHPAAASILIGICAILDFLDGSLARWLNAGSALGRQLDSLADLISFGLAPATIMYHYMKNSLAAHGPESIFTVWPLAAFLIAVFSALRLAIFNTDDKQETSFRGLPTPANALLIASLPFVMAFATTGSTIHHTIDSLTGSFTVNLAMTLALSFLLISPVRMFSLKLQSLRWKENRIRYIFLAGCLIMLILFGLAAMPLFLIFYILLSLTDHIIFAAKHNPDGS